MKKIRTFSAQHFFPFSPLCSPILKPHLKWNSKFICSLLLVLFNNVSIFNKNRNDYLKIIFSANFGFDMKIFSRRIHVKNHCELNSVTESSMDGYTALWIERNGTRMSIKNISVLFSIISCVLKKKKLLTKIFEYKACRLVKLVIEEIINHFKIKASGHTLYEQIIYLFYYINYS